MAVYEITKFNGGISDFEDRGIQGAFKFGSGLNIRKDVDSLSCQQALVDEGILAGHSPSLSVSYSASKSSSPSVSASPSPSASTGASPSPSVTPSVSVSLSPSVSVSSSLSASPSVSTGVTTVFEDIVRTFVKGSDGYTYGFGNTGRIYRRDADAFWQRVYIDPDGEIKGAEEKPATGGVTYLIWATNTIVKRKPLPGNANWSDVETVAQNLQSGVPHTMKQIGGSCFICNGSFLAMIGYDNSYTNEAVDLIPGNIAKTIVERNGRAIIGTIRAADPNKGVNAAIDCEVPLAQVGDDGELHYADMTSSIPITRFPGGGIVNPGGVTNEIDQVNFFEWEQDAISWIDKQSVGNMSLWGVYNADTGKNGVYSYGRKKKNQQVTLNLEYALEVDEIGAIVTVDGTTLISYRDGTDFGVKAVDPNNKAVGIYEGLDFKAPVKKPVNVTKWTIEELFFHPLPAGTYVEFWYKINKTGDFIKAYVGNGEDLTFGVENAQKCTFRINAQGEIFQPRIVLYPNGNNTPEVYRSRTYFE